MEGREGAAPLLSPVPPLHDGHRETGVVLGGGHFRAGLPVPED